MPYPLGSKRSWQGVHVCCAGREAMAGSEAVKWHNLIWYFLQAVRKTGYKEARVEASRLLGSLQ